MLIVYSISVWQYICVDLECPGPCLFVAVIFLKQYSVYLTLVLLCILCITDRIMPQHVVAL